MLAGASVDNGGVDSLGHLIDAEYADWDGPRLLEEEIFRTGNADRIAERLDRFCARVLGSGIARYEFFATGVASVHGVRLADGRRVVVKACRRAASASLAAAQVVQAHLASRGFPCPRPVVGPTALERGNRCR